MEEMVSTQPKRPSMVGPMVMGIVVGLIIGIGGYYAWNHRTKPATTATTAVTTATPTNVAVTTTPATTAPVATSDPTVGWKTYSPIPADSVLGYTFKYPTTAQPAQDSTYDGLMYGTSVYNTKTMQDESMGYDKSNMAADQVALAKGDPTNVKFGIPVTGSLKLLSISGVLAKEETILSAADACDMQFNRQAIIYKGDYQLNIYWIRGNAQAIARNNPSYFKKAATFCGTNESDMLIWKDAASLSAFYTALVAGTTDTLSQEWFTDFPKLISTFEFTK